MNSLPLERTGFRFVDQSPAPENLIEEVLSGLNQEPPAISPKFFYDAHGSELFEDITRQPEYYLSRTERKILKDNARDIARTCQQGGVLIEPGAGSCEKVRLLLAALRPSAYVPMDISGEFLCESVGMLVEDFPWLHATAVQADFSQVMELPQGLPDGRRVLFYPGSTVGNFTPEAARQFLSHARTLIGDDGGMLIGVDLDKDSSVLNQAYNDSAGVTARFNLNLLSHLNDVVGANFSEDRFRHVSFYNRDRMRIEMHLESVVDQTVQIENEAISFEQGERILTEYSHKYTRERFAQLASQAGLSVTRCWTDEREYFAVFYLQPLD